MRILFSCQVGHGILHPMVPLARSLTRAGHEVSFATGEHFCPWIRQLGFPAFPAGIHRDAYLDELKARFPQYPEEIPGPDLLSFYLTHECPLFAAPASVADLVSLLRAQQIDLLIHEMADFAGPIAATVVGIPYVNHAWTIRFPADHWLAAGLAIGPLWEKWGVDPGPLGGMFRHLYLDICPPALQPPTDAGINIAPVRPVPLHVPLDDERRAAEDLPDLPGGRPVVYVTLGTIFNKSPGLFSTILAALGGEPLHVLAVVGHDVDPETLGPQENNVRIVQYLPQEWVLAHSDVVISHGGAGSMFATLGAGVPMLLLPQGVDQFHNADRCVNAGVARSVPPWGSNEESIRRELYELLGAAKYQARAREIQKEIREMPPAVHYVRALEELVESTK